MRRSQLIRTDEVLRYESQLVLVRCFTYPNVVRCGAVYIGVGTPPLMPVKTWDERRIAQIRIPEIFANKVEAVVLGDGGQSGPSAKPQMIEFDINAWWDEKNEKWRPIMPETLAI